MARAMFLLRRCLDICPIVKPLQSALQIECGLGANCDQDLGIARAMNGPFARHLGQKFSQTWQHEIAYCAVQLVRAPLDLALRPR